MKEKHLAWLEKLGLPAAEAQIYLILSRAGAPMSASAIVAATNVPRGSIYPTLSSLTDKGLVEAEPGYGGRFFAIRADRALASLIAREKEEMLEREQLAAQLANELASEDDRAEEALESEFIQVLKDPRVVSERFDRLQAGAQHEITVLAKPPFNISRKSNPALERIFHRGVRARCLYEQSALDDPAVEPYLATWVTWGETARVYDGRLPHKLAIFDGKVALLPLILPGDQTKSLLIRHPRLVESLNLAFEHLWDRSKPLLIPEDANTKVKAPPLRIRKRQSNGQARRAAK